MKKTDLDDDYIIADMSNVGHKHFLRKENTENKLDLSRVDRWAVIKGTLSASLMIGLVYAVVFGLFILLLTMYFRSIN